MMSYKESFSGPVYSWAKVPEGLPHENLILMTAKTTTPTNHLNDWDHAIRVFTEAELFERGASLARRPVGLNHVRGDAGLIPLNDPELERLTGSKYAFTVDAQYNKSTEALETLLFLPITYVEMIRSGKITEPSVEFTVRNEKRVDDRLYFEGITFTRVDLLYGLPAGDPNVGKFQFVESGAKVFYAEASFTGGLGSSPDPTIDAHNAMNAVNQQNMDAFNMTITQPLINNLYFECPNCKNRYEYDITRKEWGPFCGKECFTESQKADFEKTIADMKTKMESTEKELTDAKAKIEAQNKTISDNSTAITNLQKNAEGFGKEKTEAVDKAKKETRDEIISKVSKALPPKTQKFDWTEADYGDTVRKVRDAIGK
jgi:hypothetical protein